MTDVNKMLVEALKDAAQTLSWISFGERQGISENLLTPLKAVEKAKAALAAAEQAGNAKPGAESIGWVEFVKTGGVSYDIDMNVACRLPKGVRFKLYTAPPAQVPDSRLNKLLEFCEKEKVTHAEKYAIAKSLGSTEVMYAMAGALAACDRLIDAIRAMLAAAPKGDA